METREVVVEHQGPGFEQSVTAGPHRFSLDEPVRYGGKDGGPNPYDLLLAALGGCTSMTLVMYARRKGWPLEKVTIRLRHLRVHAEDCADCEDRSRYLEQVERTITLDGPLSDDQRQRLLKIAELCPVHKTLSAPLHIVSSLAG
jgi:putative redox protein